MRYSYSKKRLIEQYRLDVFGGVSGKGRYDIPVLSAFDGDADCERLVAFNDVRRYPDISECGVHFFLDDYQFERVWNNPRRYASELKGARFVLTPDFSLFTDMPVCQQIYNTYRNRLVGAYFQKAGLPVIPSVGWSDARSYEFCFDGVPEGGVCAVSNIGCFRDGKARELWYRGFDEMVKRINPRRIIIYGNRIDRSYGNIVYFCNENISRMRGYGR